MLLLLSACGRADLRPVATSRGGIPVDPQRYASRELAQLREMWSSRVEGNTGVLVVGDLGGTAVPELAIQDGATIRLFDLEGNQTGTFELPAAGLTLAMAAEVNDDGKEDLVFGGSGGSSGYLAAYNGSGQLIYETRLGEPASGTTTPIAAFNGRLYFTAVSDLHIAPKIVGALDLAGGTPAWSYHLGPLPTGLRIREDGRVAVSNRALDRERREVETPYTADYRRHHSIVLDAEGAPIAELPFGPESANGSIVAGAFSGVQSDLVEIDGQTLVVQLLERVSDLYPGPAELRTVTLSGEVVARREGPVETDASMAVYRQDGRLRIAVYWRKAGILEIYSDDLELLQQGVVGPSPARGALLQVGNFDGDGEIEFLIADRGRIAVVSERGAVEFEAEEPTPIRDARIVRSEDDAAVLVVLSDTLRVYGLPGGANGDSASSFGTLRVHTTPPGAALRIDGVPVRDVSVPRLFELPAGDHVVEASIRGYGTQSARVTIEPGRVHMVSLDLPRLDPPPAGDHPLQVVRDREQVREVREPSIPLAAYSDLALAAVRPIPDGFGISAVGEFAGDDDPDILLFHRDGRRYLVLSNELEPLLAGRLPVAMARSPEVYGDLDGDGRAEIGTTTSQDATAIFAMTADARVILDKSFCYGFDTNVSFATRTQSQLLVTITTGYLLSPRGAYGLDIGTWETEFFYPTAGMVNGVIQRNGTYYMDLYTASNGAEVPREDGTVETDSAIYLHVVQTDGRPHPAAQALAEDEPHGSIRPFFFASDADSNPLAHYIVSKDQYYPGPSGILRADQRVERVLTSGNNRGVLASELLSGTPNFLSLVWNNGYLHQIIDSRYEVVYEHEYPDRPLYVTSVNLDGDDEWEIVERQDDQVVVRDLDRRVLRTFALPSEPVRGIRFADLTGDGRFEAIVHGDSEIALYSY